MVNRKNYYTVTPAEATPMVRLWLSEIDQVQSISHTPAVYFYPPHPSIDTSEAEMSYAQLMVESLSQALVHFYPLAGRLHAIDEGGRLEVDCNSMGAILIEAESESSIDDLGDFTPCQNLRDEFVPIIDYTKPIHEIPLLLAQLTRLRCGGLCLGTAVSHTMLDGQAALHFMDCWAQLSHGEPMKPNQKPFLDRTVLRMPDTLVGGPCFRHIEFGHPPLLVGAQDATEQRNKDSSVAMLKLSKEHIEKLKQKANVDRTEGDGRGRLYSRYEALAGHMWISSCKARCHVNEQLTSVRVTADCRSRLRPPLPPRYSGNAVLYSTPVALAGDLMSKPLSYAASKVREGGETVTDDYIRSAIDFLKKEPNISKLRRGFQAAGTTQGVFLGNPNISMTSWIGLPLYNVDFGWGNPIYVGPAILGYEGSSFVIPGDGDGSLTVVIRLQTAHMDEFKRILYQDI